VTDLERIMLWLLALIASIFGVVRIMTPKTEPGPVFKPAQTEVSASGALPTCVPGTDLQIQALVQYEGAYWEDGTGDYVSNVAALMLYNPSDAGITNGKVYLTLQEQEYLFAFTYLPAGGRILVPEKNRLPYVRGRVTECRCDELVTGDFGTEDSGIAFTQNGLSGILLENTTGGELKQVTLFYKLYLLLYARSIPGMRTHSSLGYVLDSNSEANLLCILHVGRVEIVGVVQCFDRIKSVLRALVFIAVNNYVICSRHMRQLEAASHLLLINVSVKTCVYKGRVSLINGHSNLAKAVENALARLAPILFRNVIANRKIYVIEAGVLYYLCTGYNVLLLGRAALFLQIINVHRKFHKISAFSIVFFIEALRRASHSHVIIIYLALKFVNTQL